VAYSYDRPDLKALNDLEQLLKHLTEELAGWRRRTLVAEAELAEAQSHGGKVAGPELKEARKRLVELGTENQALRHRIEAARERRVVFLDEVIDFHRILRGFRPCRASAGIRSGPGCFWGSS
jgi:hypothetical protein